METSVNLGILGVESSRRVAYWLITCFDEHDEELKLVM
jgi:hypothetical protein